VERNDFTDIIKMMICLECGEKLDFHSINKSTGVLVCTKCYAVYCQEEGVFTVLPKGYSDKEKYQNFLLANLAFFKKNLKIKSYFKKFANSIPSRGKTWEDDDVEFWDKKYLKGCLELRTKKLVARAYLRDKILFKPLREFGIRSHRILEVGCGEAISAQKLLLPYGKSFLYIATDYSYQALRFLRKKYRNSKNMFYVQCLGDAIPFADEAFDDIICLGVLHHMPKKDRHVTDLIKKLKPGGLLLSNEPYDRNYRLPPAMEKIIQKIIEPKQSAHEERLNVEKYRKRFIQKGEILNEYHGHTPIKTVLIRATGTLYEKSVTFVKFLLIVDKITEKTLGKVWNLFSTGDCLILFRKSKH
jgi:ubiquinone/menaquinone biosynthesis C-methylase UbiE/uncharacterized protein YbaR (Trm112 family)